MNAWLIALAVVNVVVLTLLVVYNKMPTWAEHWCYQGQWTSYCLATFAVLAILDFIVFFLRAISIVYHVIVK